MTQGELQCAAIRAESQQCPGPVGAGVCLCICLCVLERSYQNILSLKEVQLELHPSKSLGIGFIRWVGAHCSLKSQEWQLQRLQKEDR